MRPDKTHRVAMIELQAATAIIAMSGVLASALQMRGWSPHILMTARGILGALTLGLVVHWRGRSILAMSLRTWISLILTGVILGLHWLLYFQAVHLSGVAVAMIALFTFPVMTTLVEPFFFREKLRMRTLINAAVIVCGVALMVPQWDIANKVTYGILLSLASAVCFVSRNLLSRKFVANHDVSVVMFWQAVTVAVMFSPYWMMDTFHARPFDLFLLVCLGVVCTGIGHTLFISCMTHLRAGTASIINSLQPIYGTIYAMIFLSQYPDIRTALAGAVILLTVVGHEVMTYRR